MIKNKINIDFLINNLFKNKKKLFLSFFLSIFFVGISFQFVDKKHTSLATIVIHPLVKNSDFKNPSYASYMISEQILSVSEDFHNSNFILKNKFKEHNYEFNTKVATKETKEISISISKTVNFFTSDSKNEIIDEKLIKSILDDYFVNLSKKNTFFKFRYYIYIDTIPFKIGFYKLISSVFFLTLIFNLTFVLINYKKKFFSIDK